MPFTSLARLITAAFAAVAAILGASLFVLPAPQTAALASAASAVMKNAGEVTAHVTMFDESSDVLGAAVDTPVAAIRSNTNLLVWLLFGVTIAMFGGRFRDGLVRGGRGPPAH